MEFPIIARHPDSSVWYKIMSANHFTEWKRLGETKHPLPDIYLRADVDLKDYATAVYVSDLIASIEKGYLITANSSELFEAVKEE